MSENENPFLSIQRHDEIIQLWEAIGKDCQIFYDKGSSLLILRKNTDIFFLRPNEIKKSQKCQLKSKIENIFAFVLKRNNKLIALQNTINSILILNINNEKETLLILTKTVKSNVLNSILHFDFVYSSTTIDFFVAETSGIHFYKIDEEKVHSKEIKFIPFAMNFCWFEPKNEILCVYSVKEKGLIHTFFIEKTKSNFAKVRGPSFQLDINTNVSPKKNNLMQFVNKSFSFFVQDDNFAVDCDRKNKDLTGFMPIENVMHKIMIANLYNKTYLIHLNAFQGKAFIFYLTNDKASLITPILSVPSDGIYSLGAVDNLLLIHNHSECISMVYDIKRYHIIFPIGAPTSLPLMIQKLPDSPSSKQENKKVLPPNRIIINKTTDDLDDGIHRKIDFSKTIFSKNQEEELKKPENLEINDRKTDQIDERFTVNDLQQESMMILDDRQKLTASLDPNYMEKLMKNQEDNENDRNSNAALKNIFDRSPLLKPRETTDCNEIRTNSSNEIQIHSNNSDTQITNNTLNEIQMNNNIDNQNINIENNKEEVKIMNENENEIRINDEDLPIKTNENQTKIKEETEIKINEDPQIKINNEPQIKINEEPQIKINEEPEMKYNDVEPQVNINDEPQKIKINEEVPQINETQIKLNDEVQNEIKINYDAQIKNIEEIKTESNEIKENDEKFAENLKTVSSDYNLKDTIYHKKVEDLRETEINTKYTSDEENLEESKIKDDKKDPLKKNFEYEIDYSFNIYKDAFIFLEDEYIIDIHENKLYKIEMNLFQISKYMDDKIDAFFIILRRKNSKLIALSFLTNLIKHKALTIMSLSYIFRNLFEIYKKSLGDQATISKDSSKVVNANKKKENIEIKENKLDNGYTIINQSDCYRYIFKQITEADNVDFDYIIMIIVQFIREALECEMQPLMNIQHLLIKMILQSKKFTLFHSLLQFHVFNDSNELAHILIDFDNNSLLQKDYKNKLGVTLLKINEFENYSACFQIGVDILFRQKKFNDLVEVYFKKGMMFQGLELIKKQKLKNVHIDSIVIASQNPENNMSKENIYSFFEEIEYEFQTGKKPKQNFFSFTLEQLKNSLKI